jgi:hypothetical protein
MGQDGKRKKAKNMKEKEDINEKEIETRSGRGKNEGGREGGAEEKIGKNNKKI